MQDPITWATANHIVSTTPTLIISGLFIAFGLIGFMMGIQKDKAYLESNYGEVPSSNGIFISPFDGLLNYYDERKKIVEEG